MILPTKFQVPRALLWTLLGALVLLPQGQAHAAEAQNVRLVGSCDLQGRGNWGHIPFFLTFI